MPDQPPTVEEAREALWEAMDAHAECEPEECDGSPERDALAALEQAVRRKALTPPEDSEPHPSDCACMRCHADGRYDTYCQVQCEHMAEPVKAALYEYDKFVSEHPDGDGGAYWGERTRLQARIIAAAAPALLAERDALRARVEELAEANLSLQSYLLAASEQVHKLQWGTAAACPWCRKMPDFDGEHAPECPMAALILVIDGEDDRPSGHARLVEAAQAYTGRISGLGEVPFPAEYRALRAALPKEGEDG